MTPYIERKSVVSCPGGVPTQRIFNVKCKCGHGFEVDLGPEWKENLVLRCPKCNKIAAKSIRDQKGALGITVFG